jgi:large subunit ribosomal protein L29
MNTKDITSKDNESLQFLLDDLREELFNLKAQMATGHLKETANVNLVKKDIARVLTVLRERELKA